MVTLGVDGCKRYHFIGGGGSWIRTNVEIDSADLQSAAIDHSAIPPKIYIIEYRSTKHIVN
jgi:hypothetical protein